MLDWLVLLYAILIGAWLILRVLFFDRFWPLAILNTSAEYLLLPLPALLIVGLWRRRRPLWLGLAVPTIAFVVLFGDLFLPSRPQAHSGRLITVMSFNVLVSNEDYQALVGAIRAASPDLVGLQELNPTNAAAIAQALETDYPYHTLAPPEQVKGIGLLSRFPLETTARFPLPPLDLALRASVNLDGELIYVFIVHLSSNNLLDHPLKQVAPLAIERYGRRAAEVARLEDEIGRIDDPLLMLCDCNLTDTSQTYAHLDVFLDDSFREAGWGFGHTLHPPTFPFPVQRVDYVWHSDEFVAVEAVVGQGGGSDHLPIVAKLTRVNKP